jgi:hypothetical protein
MRRKEMATYIRNEIAKYSDISMKMNFNKFSDRQIKNILKQVRNGAVSYGHSATATVAKWLLLKYPMPHFRYDTAYIKWKDLPNGHPFFEAVKQAAAIKKISETEPSKWWMDALDDMFRIADEQKPKGSVSAYRLGEFKKTVKKTMKIEQKLSPIMESLSLN